MKLLLCCQESESKGNRCLFRKNKSSAISHSCFSKPKYWNKPATREWEKRTEHEWIWWYCVLLNKSKTKHKTSKYAFSQFCFRHCENIQQRVTFDSDFAFLCHWLIFRQFEKLCLLFSESAKPPALVWWCSHTLKTFTLPWSHWKDW